MEQEISLKLLFWALMLSGVALEVTADVLFKKWSVENESFLFILGLIIYAIGTVFWASTLKYEFLSKSASIFLLLNLIGIVLVSVLIFKDNLSFANKAGILLGIVSIVLIEMK